MCPSAPGMLLLRSSHSPIIRSDPTSLVGSVGAETGTVGPPTALPLNPATTHCSWSAAPNLEGPGCRDRVTASLHDLHSVTQEMETFPRAASTNPQLLSHSQGGGVGCPRGRHPLTHPQESPGCEKAEPGVPGTINSPQHLTGGRLSRQLCVTTLSLLESLAMLGPVGLPGGGMGRSKRDGDRSQAWRQLLFSHIECSSGTLLSLSQRSPSPRFPLPDPLDLGRGLGTAQSFWNKR